MLPDPSFTQAIQDVTPGNEAAGMGPYYPRAALCPLANLTAHGPQACLR